MSVQRWNDIFALLSMVIIADKRVFKEEVDAFINGVMEIKALATEDETLVTRNIAMEWFKAHRDEITSRLESLQRSELELRHIQKLNDYPHREAVLRTMVAVSLADNSLHRREQNLIEVAAANWKLDITRFISP